MLIDADTYNFVIKSDMKLSNFKELIPLAVIILVFVWGVALFKAPCLPDKIPSHWNLKGEIDGYMSRNFAAFFMPCLLLAMYLLLTFLPFIDPLKENYKYFATSYFIVKAALVVFLGVLYIFSLLIGLGFTAIKINHVVIPAISLLFFIIGLVLPNVKRNYFFGVRTPWALHSDIVWQKTHKFSSKVFMALGVLTLFTVFAGDWSFWIFMFVVLSGILISFAQSYWAFKKIKPIENGAR